MKSSAGLDSVEKEAERELKRMQEIQQQHSKQSGEKQALAQSSSKKVH
jgi:hypothetical protein